VLLLGGLFLLYKASHEIFVEVEARELDEHAGHPMPRASRQPATKLFWAIIGQIAVIDIVFSLDSVITAVGMVDQIGVMVAAVVTSVGVMLVAAKPIGEFVDSHPSVKVLALAFLVMVGMALTAEAFDQHVPKGYIYAAMAFSLAVEALNIRARAKRMALGNGLVDQAPVRRRGSVYRVTGQGHFQRPFAPHIAGNGNQGRVTKQSRLATGNGKRCGVRRHGQVATGHQLAASGGGQGMHAGHHRLGYGLDGVHHLGAHGKQFARLLQRGAGHVGKVVPRTENRPVGRQYDAACFGLRNGRAGPRSAPASHSGPEHCACRRG
jgi:hypothetical protein